MNDIEWLAYLDTLSPELADLARNIAERVNTLLNRERSQAIGERQTLERQSADQRTKVADIRMIVNDLVARIAALESDDGERSRQR